MRVSPFAIACSAAVLWFLFPSSATLNTGLSDGNQTGVGAHGRPVRQSSANGADLSAKSGTSDRNRELMEKEAALNLKEQELKRLSDSIDARMKELDEARRSAEATMSAKRQVDTEKYRKMLKLYKALRPEEAARLLDKLDEDLALELLNQMDTKTAAKLIPLLNEKRVLKWTRLSLINE
jgi:flagellar protein FlbB